MGIDLEVRGKHEEAVGCFDEVLTEDSGTSAFEVALSLYFKGCIHEKMNKIAEMISCYLQLLEMHLEEQDIETILHIYKRILKESVPRQMQSLTSDIPIKKSFA
jgi:Zn-dependent M16 (insulinase) family peptidase